MTATQTQKTEISEADFFKDLARNDFLQYCIYTDKNYRPEWFHRTLAEKLEKILTGEIKRLMITTPPRHGKTEIASRKFPTYAMSKIPNLNIIVSGYSQDFVEIECGAKAKDIILSEAYKDLFPNIELKKDSTAKGNWTLTNNSNYSSAGCGGAITGKGGQILIVDDAFKDYQEADSATVREAKWNWYLSVVLSRLEGLKAIIVINTRWNLDDLSGRILNKAKQTGEYWDLINFPAISEKGYKLHKDDPRREGSCEALWQAKFPISELQMIKSTMGVYLFSCLYQQNPVASENQVFNQSDFKYISRAELSQKKTRNFLTIDTDSFDPKTECEIGVCENYVDIEGFFNFSCYGLKLNPGEFINWLFDIYFSKKFEEVGIEKMMASKVIKFFLDKEMRERGKFIKITGLEPKGVNKDVRIKAGLQPLYNSGSIKHIIGECSDYENELLMFPRGKSRDKMDAAAYQIQIAQKPFPERSKNQVETLRNFNALNQISTVNW